MRNAIPFGAPGATRFLDGVSAVVDQGRGSPTLAAALANAGVSWVVLRNDIDPLVPTTSAAVVRATLIASPGISRAAGFGEELGAADPVTSPALAAAQARPGSSSTTRSAIEIFAVNDFDSTAGQPRLWAAGSMMNASAGPEALAIGRLPDDRPWNLSSSTSTSAEPSNSAELSVATDTLRRRIINFGAPVGRDYSPTQSGDVDVQRGRPRGDVPPEPHPPNQTTVTYDGIDSVTSSTAASDPFAFGFVGPQTRPFSAIDGDARTSWRSAVGDADPWWRVAFANRAVTEVTLRLPVSTDPTGLSPVKSVTVTTDSGSTTRELTSSAAAQVVRIAVPPGVDPTTRSLTVSFTPADPSRATGLTEVDIPGLRAREVYQVAGSGATDVSVGRAPGRRRSCIKDDPAYWTCSPNLAAPGEEIVALDRQFTLTASAHPTSITASASPGVVLDHALDASLGFTSSSSTRFVDDPAARPGAAFDNDRSTGWISAAHDPSPHLRVDYAVPLTASLITVRAPRTTLTRIASVVVTTESGRRNVELVPHPASGYSTLVFRELSGRNWTYSFTLRSVDPTVDVFPVRIDELDAGRLQRPSGGLKGDASAIVTGCADGPELSVDGTVRHVRITATSAEVLSGEGAAATLCEPIRIGPGPHRIRSIDTPMWQVESWQLTHASSGVTSSATATSASGIDEPATSHSVVTVTNEAEHRTYEVGPGGPRLLVMTEGANPGWAADIDGRALIPVTVNGWQQGWEIPAALSSQSVNVEFTAGGWHRLGLGVGLVALLALVGLLLWPEGKRAVRAQEAPAPFGRFVGPVLVTFLAVLLATLLAGIGGALIGVATAVVWLALPTGQVIGRLAGLIGFVCAGALAAITQTPYGSTDPAGFVHLLCVPILVVLTLFAGSPRIPSRSSPDEFQHRPFDD